MTIPWRLDLERALKDAKTIPVRIHVKEQADEFKRLGERFGVQWTQAILEIDTALAETARALANRLARVTWTKKASVWAPA